MVEKTEWVKRGSLRLSKSEKTLVVSLYDLPNRWFILDIKAVFDVIGRFEENADVLEISHVESEKSGE